MNLLYVTYYPKSDATKPSQCLGTGMTPFAVQFTFKNECSYSYGMNRGMTR
ncbi:MULTISPECIES: hypothetical protein [unclassified Wolbachia]|uniref:hypothetical protein n=1 Tax=unclassified Wolbachia TaxID=2640676 RepID=UPI003342901C